MARITVGRYIPGASIIHTTHPAIKLAGLLVFVPIVFWVGSFWLQIALFCFILFGIGLSRISPIYFFRTFRFLWFFFALIWVLQLFQAEGQVLLKIGALRLTDLSLTRSIVLCMKILNGFLLSVLFSATVSPMQLSDSIESFLRLWRVRPETAQDFSMVFNIALKFFPILFDEADHLMKAQKSKGAPLDYGGLISRLKAVQRVIIPLLFNTIKRADDLSIALEVRGYAAGEKRTKFRRQQPRLRDWCFLAVIGCFSAMMIYFEGLRANGYFF
ncbi:MAG TPA: energy-coupling factor transporter transmembrane component T [Thermotogota bacterium]|nr:energy-coupling factor transporter transmembrane component T [Thermotogota bacterium]HPB86098.1 energy-coupling factor transporter transmembrane component T [Thermotogota bacterium]HQC38322.1 energy-coupling factor transporter transmembrane component T [Thermotogota bacterium]HQQ64711.1 energy-coupling factor transporter transmembrane component T [Thermotogota bacterium]